MVDNTAKPKTTSFFPLWKLKGNQPLSKMAAMHLAHLEEESAERNEGVEIKDLDGINGVMEEFMVQQPQALYPQLPTSESLQREYAVKLQGGDDIEEGNLDPSDEDYNAQ